MLRDHLRVIAAMEARDGDKAAAAMLEHIANARARAIEL
ncbi:MAG: FCD domain-containing protein [Bosea sp. (in: a-proteobacteria)]